MSRTQDTATVDRFRALVEQIPAITYIADFDESFTLRYVSPQCEEILGFDPEAWVRDPRAWVAALHPEDRDRIVAEAEACVAARRPFDFEYRMIAADGRTLHFWEKTSFALDASGQPYAVNGVMLDVTELKLTQAALRHQAEQNRHQALHDDLTGLPNRRELYERLDEAVAIGEPFALLLIDLDRFKEVNDVLGHECGDELLREVARRFAAVVREGDLLARLGGDEFALLVRTGPDSARALQVARRLTSALEPEFLLGDVPVHVEGSIGLARHPEDGTDPGVLLRCADTAMYCAKELSTELELFDGRGTRHTRTRLQRLGELRRALAREELVLHYQPKLELGSGRVVGAEALVRWQHPEHGLLPPVEFVPLAEQTGLIRPLTTFVLSAALAQLRAWRRAGRDLAVAVNVSERSLLDPAFPDEVRAQLERAGVDGRHLELEITEGTIMADPGRAAAVLERLSSLGVRLSLDDFGTGYSSLSRLRELPIDEIKIDRVFVSRIEGDERDVAIIRSTIELGHTLGCSVVAEGLETAAAMLRVASLGCDTAQGFHIARPLEAQDFDAWLQARS
jgi:diguanylate cyclase (GGDEF)-like protein/PAS domain S-box-containing protein